MQLDAHPFYPHLSLSKGTASLLYQYYLQLLSKLVEINKTNHIPLSPFPHEDQHDMRTWMLDLVGNKRRNNQMIVRVAPVLRRFLNCKIASVAIVQRPQCYVRFGGAYAQIKKWKLPTPSARNGKPTFFISICWVW